MAKIGTLIRESSEAVGDAIRNYQSRERGIRLRAWEKTMSGWNPAFVIDSVLRPGSPCRKGMIADYRNNLKEANEFYSLADWSSMREAEKLTEALHIVANLAEDYMWGISVDSFPDGFITEAELEDVAHLFDQAFQGAWEVLKQIEPDEAES